MTYPEHEKQTQVREVSQAQGELLEWLQSQGVNLMRWEQWQEPVDVPCRRCGHWSDSTRVAIGPCRTCDNTGVTGQRMVDREGWLHDPRSTRTILAEYHGIDLDAIEREKRAMLDKLRGESS